MELKTPRRTVFCLVFFLLGFGLTARGLELPKWFVFNRQAALEEWQEKVFKDRVLYQVRDEDKDGFLAATSENACSGLFYKMKFNVRENPMLSWNWKVTTFPQKESIGQENKDGWLEKDDYAARVYVIFSSWNFFNTKSLEYIWDETLPPESIKTSPFIDNIRLIVAESGHDSLGQWVAEERNIHDDFVRAFGEEPPKYASAIALMTDADNTVSKAEAFYRDIRVGYRNDKQE